MIVCPHCVFVYMATVLQMILRFNAKINADFSLVCMYALNSFNSRYF